MIEVKKQIFGRVYSFRAEGRYRELVERSIEAYPDAVGASVDVEVFSGGQFDASEFPMFRNPKIFTQYQDSFVTDFGPVCIRWCRKDQSKLSVHVLLREPLTMFSPIQRWRSMEFSNLPDYFQQVLHELVLIPSVFFSSDRVPLHAAAVCVGGKAVLIAGTGGTGKTSALLSLRDEDGVAFVSDDICIVSPQGRVFPNLSWPKVYGYNVPDAGLRRLLLKDRGLIDKLHFGLRRRVNPARVRRKIRPQKLFRVAVTSDVPLSTVLMLARSNVQTLLVEPLDPMKAVQMNIAVMQTEYFTFFRFLFWKEFNDLFDHEKCELTADILEGWRRNLARAFSTCRVLAVRIPMMMPHEEYIGAIRQIVLDQGLR